MQPLSRRLRSVVLAAALGCTLVACTAEPSGTASAASSTSPAQVASPAPATSSPGNAPTAADPADPATAADPTTDPVSGRTTVSVRVPNSGWNTGSAAVEVGAFVEGVVEEGGSCTLTLTRGSKVVTAQAGAIADASITGCGDLSVSGTSLSSGTWSATVTYASVTSAGTSAALDIEVP